jgi:mRNA interferase RelE/StbE
VQRELDALQGSDYRRVLGALETLGDEPRPPGCEKLYDAVYRVRVGRWRIIYLVDQANRRVEVGGIRRRTERTYRGVDDLFT